MRTLIYKNQPVQVSGEKFYLFFPGLGEMVFHTQEDLNLIKLGDNYPGDAEWTVPTVVEAGILLTTPPVGQKILEALGWSVLRFHCSSDLRQIDYREYFYSLNRIPLTVLRLYEKDNRLIIYQPAEDVLTDSPKVLYHGQIPTRDQLFTLQQIIGINN